MSASYPVSNDNEVSLLKKIVDNTALIATGGESGTVTSILGTTGKITVSAATGNVTISIPAAMTGINSIASAAGQSFTLSTSTAGNILLSPFGSTAGFSGGYVDLVGSPADGVYVSTLRFGAGNRYGLVHGTTTFSSVPDHSGGIYYNPQKTAGDVSFGLGFENAFKNGTSYSTEFYYAWSGVEPVELGNTRPIQINTSWGVGYSTDGLVAGFTQTSLSANKFTVVPGGGFAESGFFLNFVPVTPDMFWGGTATISSTLTVSNGGIMGGAGSMNIVAGTGASRSITIQTTNGAGTAQNAMQLGSDRAMNLYSTTVATDATTGAFIINNQFSVGGTTGNVFANGLATIAGGIVVYNSSVPAIVIGSGTGTSLIGFATVQSGRYFTICGNRNPLTGTFVNTGGTDVEMVFDTGSADGNILFRTSSSNNTGGTDAVKINKSQGLQVLGTTEATVGGAGALTVAGGLFVTKSGFFAGPVCHKNYTVATLPAAATYIYGIVFITDATLTAITGLGLAPIGGGSNKVPVYSDGSGWIII